MRLATLFPTFAVAGAIAVCLAQTPASVSGPAAGSGRSMIDKAVAALGGDRFLHLQNRLETGRLYGFFHDRLSGLELVKAYVSYIGPDSTNALGVQERQYLGKKHDYSYLFTPSAAWDITFRGARQVPDEDWARYIRSTRNDVLYILRCRLQEPGLQFDYIGPDIYISRHVEIVDITDAQDQTVRIYLDHNTMLPIHETYSWFDTETKEHNDASADYDKFRDIGGGVTWPFVSERARNGYKIYQMFADTVVANQEVPVGTFAIPTKAKILRPVQ